jgi:MFS family permease
MTAKSERYEVLHNKEFMLFIAVRFFLTIALQMQAVVVGWQIFSIMKDPLSLGLIGLAEAIPALSIALYAGHVADMKSKRMILVRALLVLLFCSIGLTIFTTDDIVLGIGGSNSVRLLYVFIFISGFARGFYAPTSFAFLSQLVKREQLTVSSTLNSSVWQIAAIFGPALGGFLYAYVGITTTFFIILFLVMLSLLLVLFIAPKPVIPPPFAETIYNRLKEGVQYVWKDKVVLSALSLDLFAVLFGGAVALLPVFADEILHVGAEGLGMLRAAPSLGASITMIMITAMRPIAQPGKVLLWCVGAFGISIIGFGLSTSFYLSLFMLFCSGAFDSVSVVIRGNILQLQTPDHMRGRVSAVNSMFIGSSNEIGAFESGLAAKLLGTVPSVIFGGGMTLLVVGFTSFKAKALKQFRYQ